MILNISGRTDIVAFYTPWFMKRYKEGYVDVRNPFYKESISRIKFDKVDMIVFCTKNPCPIIPYIHEIKQPIIFHITITPYHKEIEPNVPDKKKIISAVQKLSTILGKDKIYIRYDPIFLNEKYTIDYHLKAFDKLTEILEGYTENIIISFLDDYKNVKTHASELKIKKLTETDYKKIGTNFIQSAKKHNIKIRTCYEEKNLVEYGFEQEPCVPRQLAYQLTGKKYKKWKARGCECAEMVDIGGYNTCPHLCKYCYANYDEKQIEKNRQEHNIDSSLLIGKPKEQDKIKERVEK